MRREIDVSPEALELFAVRLRDFSRKLDTATENLDRELGALGSGWEDRAFDRFYASVRRVENRMLDLTAVIDRFSVYLMQKAEQAAQVHRQELE